MEDAIRRVRVPRGAGTEARSIFPTSRPRETRDLVGRNRISTGTVGASREDTGTGSPKLLAQTKHLPSSTWRRHKAPCCLTVQRLIFRGIRSSLPSTLSHTKITLTHHLSFDATETPAQYRDYFTFPDGMQLPVLTPQVNSSTQGVFIGLEVELLHVKYPLLYRPVVR